jgi:hypothetical protein
VHSSPKKKTASRWATLLGACSFGLVAAGCHHHNLDSGFGVAWTTLSTSDDAGVFASYIITIDSVVLVGKNNGAISAIAIPETVDFTKLTNLSELWATASVPVDTYTQAIITVDYTSAQISVMVNGQPVKATITDPQGITPTTITVTVNLDPANQLTLQPTFATSNALRLAFNLDLTASNSVNLTASPPTVSVKPFMTISTLASDNKLIRVRGPLINSSVGTGTYSVVVRPFFDEVNSLGIDSIFNDANTVYTLGGVTYVGNAGLTQLSQTSAGSTETAAFTTFEPTTTPATGISAGIFRSVYVVAGGTLEDFFTYGLEGDVIARTGNTLTLRGATLFANAAQLVQYQNLDSTVLIGPATLVTADGISTLGALDSSSIAVGQHITARGLYSVSSAGVVTLDSTGATSTDTGSIRIQSTPISGTVVSSAAGSSVLNLQTIANWPIANYNFAGNGVSSAQDPIASNFIVNTGALTVPTVNPGDPLFVDGIVAPFGSAPPDFTALDVNAEAGVPATIAIAYATGGTAAPFSVLTSTSLTIDLSNAAIATEQMRIGGEIVDLKTLSASPSIVPAAATSAASGLPLFSPVFTVGAGSTSSVPTTVSSFNGFAAFVTQLNTTFATPKAATQVVARGLFNRAANTFTASSIDVVL